MKEELLVRLQQLAVRVVEETYPEMRTQRPSHFEGVVAILVREFEHYDPSSIGTDEHVCELMRIDLNELKISLL